MPESRIAYPPEFRQQMIELVRSGRSPGSLAKEFEPSAQTIHTCPPNRGNSTPLKGISLRHGCMSICLQLRMLLELIVFSSLVSNQDVWEIGRRSYKPPRTLAGR